MFLAIIALHVHPAFAGTPFAQGRSCGAPGQTFCPSGTPVLTPWTYQGNNPVPSPQAFGSVSDLGAWFEALYVGSGYPTYCSLTLSYSPHASPIYYTDGIETYYWESVSLARVWSPSTSCASNDMVGDNAVVSRSLYCPVGSTLTYTSSPLVGPYCGLPTATASPFKQIGRPSGGSTIKGEPVDVSNGNNYHEEIDYTGGGNNPIKFVRSYNSLIGHAVASKSTLQIGEQFMGHAGWTATYFQYLLQVSVTDSTTTYNTIYAYRPDGRVLTFNEYQGVYSPDGDVADRLISVSGGGWQYQTADDTIETYNAAGQLLSVAARGQAPITVSYSTGSGLGDPPVSVSDAFGHSLQFSYEVDVTNAVRLSSITDPAGHTISYSYDRYGRLTTVTNADGTTRQYGYDTVTNGWLMVSLTDEAAVLYASWTHGGSGLEVLSSQLAGGVAAYSYSYVINGNNTITSATVTDPLGKSRTYSQELLWGVNRTTTSSAPCPGCGEDQTRVLDADGNITSRTDFNGNQTTYVYNTINNLETSRTEAYGTAQARTITTAWDANWREPDLITEPNRATAFTYDGMGNVLTKTITDTTVTPNVTRTWTYTYDSYGRMLTAQGPRTDVNSTTTYSYYTCTTGVQCGEIETITDPVGHVTTFNTYNAHGQPLTITDPNGVVTTLTYDLRQRLTSRQVGTETTSYSYYPTGLLETVTLPDSSTITYTYDSAHRLTGIADTLGNSIAYTLDNMGNRTAEKTYDPTHTLRRTHTRVINSLNEDYQEVNAAGTGAVTTTLAYDNNGNLTSSDAPLSRNTVNQYDALNRPTQITDPNSGVTQLGYDANDNLASVKDPRGLTTSYSHNGFGNLTQLVSPDTGTSTDTYDSGGNLSTATDARSAKATYSYDAANRLTQAAYSDETINYTYDAGTNGIGRLTGASDANHSLAWTYDTLGRVIGKGQTVGGVGLSVGYGYTNNDMVKLVTASGQTLVYSYTNHQITSITVNGTTLLSGVNYFPYGPVSGWIWGNSTTASRTYDTDGKISAIATAADTINFGYDNAFRITSITDTGTGANTWTLGYDPLDRLTSAATTSTINGWTYDANGNRLTQTGTTAITFTPSTTSNQLNSTSGGLVRSYSYDAAGNTASYQGVSLTFNQRGRASSVISSGSTTNYIYSALGQLIEKYGASGTTLLVYDEAGHLLGEYTSTGALIQETVWMGDIPVATLRPNGSTGCTSAICVFYVHTDQLNAPRKITQPSSNSLVWRWDADPFGTVVPNQNPAGLGTFIYNLRFPGQYYQAETGLNYNYFRDYDPLIGKYVESDPIGLKSGINTYSYTLSNPIAYVDSSGLDVTITIIRTTYTPRTIIGTISVASDVTNQTFNGFTLENANPPNPSLPVPPGTYTANPRPDHRIPRVELNGVPNATNVEIHPGNTAADVIGCFAVGTTRSENAVGNSANAMRTIDSIIAADGTGNLTVIVIGPTTGP
jgi:RHS repeat-associated protein